MCTGSREIRNYHLLSPKTCFSQYSASQIIKEVTVETITCHYLGLSDRQIPKRMLISKHWHHAFFKLWVSTLFVDHEINLAHPIWHSKNFWKGKRKERREKQVIASSQENNNFCLLHVYISNVFLMVSQGTRVWKTL